MRLDFAHSPAMGSDLDVRRGHAIRTARKQRQVSTKEIADACDVTVQAVGNWERGDTAPSANNLSRVAALLRIDPVALHNGELRYLADHDQLSEAEVVTDAAPVERGPLNVEVWGTSVGGDDEEFEFNGEVSERVARPVALWNARIVFGVRVLGDSMEPRFERDDLVFCTPRTPAPGDDVIIELYPQLGRKSGKCFIKRLVRRTEAKVLCLQFNPRKQIEFNASDVQHIYRVVPNKELYGR